APDALAAVLDVASEQVGGAFLTIVLGSYVLERRANQLGVDAVARRAGLALEQRFAVLGERWLQHQRAAEGEQRNQDFLHGYFLKADGGILTSPRFGTQ